MISTLIRFFSKMLFHMQMHAMRVLMDGHPLILND
jgi:hypothetical protein